MDTLQCGGYRWPAHARECFPSLWCLANHIGGPCDSLGARRPVSTHAVQKLVSRALPLAARIFHDRMAQRANWRVHHGYQARRALPGMLLDADGITVRVRSHEPDMGCGPERFGALGKACAIRPYDCAHQWCCNVGRCNRSSRSPLSADTDGVYTV